MKIYIKTVIFSSVLLGLLDSCTFKKAEDLSIQPVTEFCDTISFAEDVFPIFSSICANPNCHVEGTFAPFALTTHEEISDISGILLPVLRHETTIKMPLDPLTFEVAPMIEEEKIAAIECWIRAGKPNN